MLLQSGVECFGAKMLLQSGVECFGLRFVPHLHGEETGHDHTYCADDLEHAVVAAGGWGGGNETGFEL